MSAVNGDKSRFHRERKQKLARRKRTRELLNQSAIKPRSVDRPAAGKPGSVSA
jgi:hypothetical protein